MPDPMSDEEHDAETFRACLMLADTVRVFLLQNHKALSTLDELNILSSECGLRRLSEDSARADAARVARIHAARQGERHA